MEDTVEAATQEAGIINHRRSSTAAATINHHLNSNTAADITNHHLNSITAAVAISSSSSTVNIPLISPKAR